MKESYGVISFPLVVNPKPFFIRSHIWIFQQKNMVIKEVDREQIAIWYGYHD
jgi:hypothetical protein